MKRSPNLSRVRSMRLISMMSEPMPRIIAFDSFADGPRRSGSACAGGSGAGLVHERTHSADGVFEAGEDRLAYQEVTDVEFSQGLDSRNRPDSVVGQAVSSMALESDGLGMRCCGNDARKFAVTRCALGMAIGSG